MAAKPRVLPPTSTKGLYVLSIGIGLLFGVIATWISFWASDALSGGMSSSSGTWMAVIVLTSFVFPAWLFGRVVARVHARFVPQMLAAIVYAPACITGAILVFLHWKSDILITPMGQAFSPALALVLLLSIAVYAGIVSGLLAAVVFSGSLTERFLGRAVITQTGLICWVCGYNLGSHTITTCPECGIAFDAHLPPHNNSYDYLAFLKRRRRWPLLIGLLFAIIPLAYSTTTQTIPAIRFLNAALVGGELRSLLSINFVTENPSSVSGPLRFSHPLHSGWWIPDPIDPDAGIGVAFLPRAFEGKPRMFITRGCLQDSGAAAGFPQSRALWTIYPGTENVVAKLTSAQADEVVRTRTVPSALIAALRAKADEVHWAVQSSSTKWPSGEHSIDPAPFFSTIP